MKFAELPELPPIEPIPGYTLLHVCYSRNPHWDEEGTRYVLSWNAKEGTVGKERCHCERIANL